MNSSPPSPPAPTRAQAATELLRRRTARRDVAAFLACCRLKDRAAGLWVPFQAWPAQLRVLEDLQAHTRVCVLKARQLGFTWAALAWALFLMVTRRTTVL